MNDDPSHMPYNPDEFGQPVQHDAPTEMFSAPPPPGPISLNNGQTPWTRPRPIIRPEQLIRPNAQRPPLPGPLPAKIKYLWHSDPAYKVFFVAIGVVVLCSIFGVFLLGNAFSHGANSSSQTANTAANLATTPTQSNNSQAQSTATAKPQPTPTPFPTPTPTPMPTPTPTTAPAPTATPVPTLTAQITSIPQSADNRSTVSVTVASIPGATVWLTILIQANPPYITTTQQSADANGTAVINWHINERSFSAFLRQTTAQVTAHAQGSNGQQVQSQPAQITINLGN